MTTMPFRASPKTVSSADARPRAVRGLPAAGMGLRLVRPDTGQADTAVTPVLLHDVPRLLVAPAPEGGRHV